MGQPTGAATDRRSQYAIRGLRRPIFRPAVPPQDTSAAWIAVAAARESDRSVTAGCFAPAWKAILWKVGLHEAPAQLFAFDEARRIPDANGKRGSGSNRRSSRALFL